MGLVFNYLAIFAACIAIDSLPCASASELPLSDLIRTIKTELYRAQQEATGDPRLNLDRVELELSITSTTELEGGMVLSVPVLELTGGRLKYSENRAASQRLFLVFEPEGDLQVSPPSGSLGLADRLIQVKEAIQETINLPPPMKMTNFRYGFDFAVVQTSGGGIDLYVFEAGAADIKKRFNRIEFFLSEASM